MEAAPEAAIPGLRRSLAERFGIGAASYGIARFLVLRLLGLVLFVAFLGTALDYRGLIGERGLLPVTRYLDAVHGELGSSAVRLVPTLFWLDASNTTLAVAAWLGVALSFAVLLGVTNAGVMLALWALYGSFVHVGQTFWGYGWELQLLETTFLAVFLCPLRTFGPFPKTPPPLVLVVLLRWLTFRIFLGAGLIKLRGDPCWETLTCLYYHYETQPNPSPASWLLQQAPPWFHQLGVLVNHAVELVLPWLLFGPRRARLVAGAAMVGFQGFLIVSGNLSFLNWLTIVPVLACFDDRALARLVPRRLAPRFVTVSGPSRPHRYAAAALALLVALLSLEPIANLASPHQAMNHAYEPFALVNTYGAFGSVGEERREVILEGTRDAVLDDATVWHAYELPCQPGDVERRPCVVTPYHYRLDWQLWFAALSQPEREPWFVKLVHELLVGNPDVLALFAKNPFPDGPPRYVRASFYRYAFTRLGDPEPGYWKRTYLGSYLPPLQADDPALLDFLERAGLDVPVE